MDLAAYIIYFTLFASIGVAEEVLFTSLLDYASRKKPEFKGESSLWMFPVFGFSFFMVLFVHAYIDGYAWWMRGFVYLIIIYIWEFVSGWTIRKIAGAAPWDYSKKKYNIAGLVCLDYAPLWYVDGLMAEALFFFFTTHLVF